MEDNKLIARHFFEVVFSQGKLAMLDEIIDPEFLEVGPAAFPGLPHGPEGMKLFITAYRNAFPDLRFVIEEQIAEGDAVVSRWTASGTHLGELAGIPPTGKSASVPGVSINRFRNGKMIAAWAIFDQFGMLKQLGVIPA